MQGIQKIQGGNGLGTKNRHMDGLPNNSKNQVFGRNKPMNEQINQFPSLGQIPGAPGVPWKGGCNK